MELIKPNFQDVIQSNLSTIDGLLPKINGLDQTMLCLANAVFGKCDNGAQSTISLGAATQQLQGAYGKVSNMLDDFALWGITPNLPSQIGMVGIIASPVNNLMTVVNQAKGFVASVKDIIEKLLQFVSNPFSCVLDLINEIEGLTIVFDMIKGFEACIDLSALEGYSEMFIRNLLGQLIPDWFKC